MKQLLFLTFSFILAVHFQAKSQTALDFDGVDDYVQTTYPGISGDSPRTIMAWINTTENSIGNQQVITDYGTFETSGRFTFCLLANNALRLEVQGNGISGTIAVNDGDWHHVAVTYDPDSANNFSLYVDGNLDVAGNVTVPVNTGDTADFKIGRRIDNVKMFNGQIDDVSVWDEALTQMEVTDYSCITEDPTTFPNLVAYYDFNEGTGTTLTDLAGGYDGTLMNMTDEDWVFSEVCEPGYFITFEVTEDDGITPIENAEVDLDGEIQFTNTNGEVVYFRDTGTYPYAVSKIGYTTQSGNVDVIDDDVIVSISMPLSGVNFDVTFMVTDETGTSPIENALVDLDGVQQYTNEFGETTFTGYLPGTFPYTISKEGYSSASGNVDVIDDNITVPVSLALLVPSALEFDGVDDYVQTSFPGVLGTTPRTFKAWIYLDAAPTGTMCISDYGVNAVGSRNTFIVNGAGYLGYLSGGTNANITATVATVPIGSWVHVAFVYDGTNGFLYQDGVEVGSGNLTTVNTPSWGENLMIGERVAGGSIPFEGKIDEVSIWDVALTAQEITDYACISDPASIPNLLAYYNFNDGTGTILTDLSWGGYNGTLMNMTEEDWVPSDVCGSGYNITFIVTEDDGTTPIENAAIDLDGEVKYTNLNGEAVYFYNDPGAYAYTVSKPGYFDETGTVDVVDDDVTVEVSLVLTGIDYDITFIVTDELTGSPLEDALVDLEGVQQYTDEFGETVFTGYLEGTFNYTISISEYYDLIDSVVVVDDDVTVNAGLQPILYYDITFNVTDETGTIPLEDALVDLEGLQQYTNASGETTFTGYLPGTYDYEISHDEYYGQIDSVELVDDDVTVSVGLQPILYYDITFVVTDETGTTPLEDALVDLDGVQQYTNASGETTFTGYLPGTYTYSVSKEDYYLASGEVDVVDDNVTVEVSLSLVGDGSTALEFDGMDDYVQTSFPGVMGMTPRTFVAWIYLSSAPTGNICITDYGLNAPGSRNTFIVRGDGFLGYISGGTNANISAITAQVPVGSWVHVAFVYDDTHGFLYQNGEEVGTGLLTAVNTPTSGEDFKIGERVAGGNIPFNGMIDEVSVWDVALTQQQISDYSCVGDPAQYDNLLAYYNFNEGTGTTLFDLAGGYNGTLVNMGEEDWVVSEVCESGFNITFIVTEDGTVPVEDATVELDGVIKYTDANGEVTFYYYDPGSYDYTISKSGYYDQTGSVDVIDDHVTLDVILPPITYYDITFIVTEDPGGDPVENATVNLDGIIQWTNSNGETTFTPYLPGTYGYVVIKDGYDMVMGDAVVVDQDLTVEVALPLSAPVYAISFLVTEQPGGVAVEDALVDLDGVQQYTNEFGLTTFSDYLPGSYPYDVSKDGYYLVSGTAEVIDENLMIEIELLISNIQQNEITGLSIYPNPTSGVFTIRFSDESRYNVTISDISGHIIDNFILNEKYRKIDLTGVQKGYYFLTIRKDDKIFKSPLIIH